MRLLFIRHADPDYQNDSLTEVGKKEANALAEFLSKEEIDAIFVSPLGRARETLEAYLQFSKTPIKPIVKDWLREFNANTPHDATHSAWDFLPSTLEEAGEEAYSPNTYLTSIAAYRNSDFKEKYDNVASHIDELLSTFGYLREKHHYKVKEENTKTIAFFCHFGVEAMILSHLINSSPITLCQHFCALPSSVTTVYTEERRKGIAQFRISEFGGVSHLLLKGMKPSFSARFSETYSDPRRHD